MNTFLVFLKGLLMGVADVIPGVSGGTMAFITGIYDRLILALGNLSTTGRHWLRREWEDGWELIDWEFLVPLAIGLMAALTIGIFTVPPLINAYPTYVFSFFIGLILVSAYIVFKHIKTHDWTVVLAGLLGLAAGYAIAVAPGFETPGSPLFMLFLGFVSISAMLLPGISGSYILLMFGQYEHLLDSIRTLDWPIFVSYKVGAVIGLLVFSKFLSWLLKRYHSRTFGALTGVMIGALYRPGSDALMHATAGMYPAAAGFLLLGVAAVMVVEYVAGNL